ncbi:MAG: aminoacyl-tRNA hydrolase [Clostridiales bacterium]|nr:aminoacyl-tRNA hydrolase [Clostridiales bacterium]
MFKKKDKFANSGNTPEFIIAGLGNPGSKYEMTRHNAGFLTLDLWAQDENFKIDKLKFKSLFGDVQINGHRCLVMKPQTFMNNSGEALRDAAQFYKIQPENIIIIYDDISLDIGKMRIRRKGSDGGHNGIKSIIYHLNSDQFPRIKIGVGAKPHPDYDLADWVLSSFKKEDYDSLKSTMRNAIESVKLIVDGEIDKAMSNFNS